MTDGFLNAVQKQENSDDQFYQKLVDANTVMAWNQKLWNQCQSELQRNRQNGDYNESASNDPISKQPRQQLGQTLHAKPRVPHSVNEMLSGNTQDDQKSQHSDCTDRYSSTKIQSMNAWYTRDLIAQSTNAMISNTQPCDLQSQCNTNNVDSRPTLDKAVGPSCSTELEQAKQQVFLTSSSLTEVYNTGSTNEGSDQPLDLSVKRSVVQSDTRYFTPNIKYPWSKIENWWPTSYTSEAITSMLNNSGQHPTVFDFLFRQKYNQTLRALCRTTEAVKKTSSLSPLPIRNNYDETSRSFVQFYREQWLRNVGPILPQKIGQRSVIHRELLSPELGHSETKPTIASSIGTPGTTVQHFNQVKSKSGSLTSQDHQSNKLLRRPYTEAELSAAVRAICFGRLGTRRAASVYGIPRSTLRNKICKLNELKRREEERQGGQPIQMADFLQSLLKQMRQKPNRGQTDCLQLFQKHENFTTVKREVQKPTEYNYAPPKTSFEKHEAEFKKRALKVPLPPNYAASIFQVNCRKNYVSRKPGEVALPSRLFVSPVSRNRLCAQEPRPTENMRTLQLTDTSSRGGNSEDTGSDCLQQSSFVDETDRQLSTNLHPSSNTVIDLQLRERLTTGSSRSAFQPIGSHNPN